MTTFSTFARIVADSFQDIAKRDTVFVANLDGEALWEKYLSAFPAGTDPIFKVRTWHDCSCCKQFIRRAGGVVVIKEGVVCTVWDQAAARAPEHYADIATALQQAVQAAGIRDIFRVGKRETHFGLKQSRSLDKETQKVLTWEHFYTGEIDAKFRVELPDSARGNYRTTTQVFERGLTELSADAVSTVLGLIEGNALYRGEEHKRAVVEFQKMQRTYRELENHQIDVAVHEQRLFVWANANSPAARFRNTVIGTLVQDLSEGQDLETAVKSFETKVAPQNYKRTTALITPMMIKKAMETITELGLEPALERRFAVIGDVSVNDVKWVDGVARSLMKGGIGDVLMQHAAAAPKSKAKEEDHAEDVALSAFMKDVLPQVQAMEAFFTGKHLGNLMALTAPVHPEPKQLFRWTNDFAWSYGGNVADSIKERVKKAGGKVDGATLRISLSWFNYDDLDLHVHEPPSRGMQGIAHISFRNKIGWTGGTLDVDMNAGRGTTREPVENIVWARTPPDGPYRVVVNNFNLRETSNPGFVIEVECGGKLAHYSFNKQVRNAQDITVVTLHMKNGVIERVEAGDPGITSSNISQEKWGLTTEQYVKISTVMLSPNYWGDNAVGNRHTFFVLEGAKSDEDMRGFYNEFLHPRLEPHRKVFEIIGDKTKCQPTTGHLAGLGFSSTKPDELLVRVQLGKKRRVFNIQTSA
jgi:hypothetical protein